MTELTYLASPYFDPDPSVRLFRFRAVSRVAAGMMKEGTMVFSPISHCHPMAEEAGLPKGWGFWGKYDEAMLSRCQKMVVLKLPGWDKSEGVSREIELAREFGIPVEFMETSIVSLYPPMNSGVSCEDL